ncbi:helix-turn-helix transcriptional regulator [Erythrobacter sp. KY5]|uniref:response regulator transcription factor n=1 Tax=Erythrobacter sp. KY5 TaxID=2011159 RepID=UPI000DBF31D1|nr:LuxR C-terminal-related transcriptional regulator [Erythrobacter sp. KY5]AWW75355.1 helix-turn-helix transcriptional regulator [Erythrobacter sp. KY5]
MSRKASLHFIDANSRHRAELARVGFQLGHHAEVYGDLSELSAHPPRDGIIIARDQADEGGVGIILERLSRLGIWLPVIAMDADPRPGRIVEAIKAGALDYLTLPIETDRFERCLTRIEKEAEIFGAARRRMIEARDRIASLSTREREVLEWLAEGSSNKVIARELDISPRTVEIHRANMMHKLGARHAAEAVRLKIEANLEPQIEVTV